MPPLGVPIFFSVTAVTAAAAPASSMAAGSAAGPAPSVIGSAIVLRATPHSNNVRCYCM